MKLQWTGGNRVELLENGEQYYPAVFGAIATAEREVLVETFILFDDPVGRELQKCLIEAARRGVEVDLTADGFGSPNLPDEFIAAMTDAGVRVHIYEPTPFVRQLNPLRRLHRKITVVDGRVAFVGGINFSEDHLQSYGRKAKQDYAVKLEGPVVEHITRFAHDAIAPVRRRLGLQRWWRRLRRQGEPDVPQQPDDAGGSRVAFITRDNRRHRNDIERAYRMAIRTAREDIVIANAYFFPGYRFLRDLRRAARRGVKVTLVLQRDPDVAIARLAGRLLYRSLIKDGVAIHEFCRCEIHGKVAVVDSIWATVGSSNLDPLSLSLNLEANVLIRDREFASALREHLLQVIERDCQLIKPETLPQMTMWHYVVGALAFHVARGFPRWLNWLPHYSQRVRTFIGHRRIDSHRAVDATHGGD